MINIKNLSKSFKNQYGSTLALDNITLTIPEAQTMALIGPSGSGKTTLLRCILGLEPYDSGSIHFPPLDALHKTHKGMVFQGFNLFPHLSILDNITLGLQKVLLMPLAEANAQALELLTTFGIDDLAQRYPSSLSGGQQQRVAIVRALALKPQLMLFDEPTSALDPERCYQVVELFQRLNKHGVSILVVTHDLSFAKAASHTIAHLQAGAIEGLSTTEDYFSSIQGAEKP